MICKICGAPFYVKRGILDLFDTIETDICRNCIIKHGINLDFENITLDIYEARIVSLFRKKEKIEYNLFTNEFSKIYQSLVLNKNYEVLFLDHIKIDDEFIEDLDAVSKLLDSNLIIMCLTKSILCWKRFYNLV